MYILIDSDILIDILIDFQTVPLIVWIRPDHAVPTLPSGIRAVKKKQAKQLSIK